MFHRTTIILVFSRALPSFPFEVATSGRNKHNVKCRIWLNVLDRKDGSYIVRYKVYETCKDFTLSVTYKNKHVGGSPYGGFKWVYSEDNNCPEKSFKKWFDGYECRDTNEQIEDDLKVFDSVNFTEYRERILSIYDRPTSYSLCNYVILDNQVRNCWFFFYVL